MNSKNTVIPFYYLLIGLISVLGLTEKIQAQIVATPQINDLMDRWKDYNQETVEVKGWRIQLLATVDRRQVESKKRSFENKYSDYPTHLVNNQPYFLLTTGAFLSTQKAQAFLKKFQRDYPGAIVVEDIIKTEEFLLYDQ